MMYLTTRYATGILIALCLSLSTEGAAGETGASLLDPFDASKERILGEVPEAGHRFGKLAPQEREVLWRGFALPMDAISNANSTTDLAQLAEIRPLPDPSRPFLPVPSAAGVSDPFGGEAADSSLGPLGRLFDLEAGGVSEPTGTADLTGNDFIAEDPFGDSSSEAIPESTDSASENDQGDPFGDDADPFADPFADF